MFSRIKKLFSRKRAKAERKAPDSVSEAEMKREFEKAKNGTFQEPARDARRSHPGSLAGRI